MTDPIPPKRQVVRLATHPRRLPESLAEAVSPVDRRTRMGKALAALRTGLVRHVGGKPSETQAAMIEICVQLKSRLIAMDAAFVDRGEMPAHDGRQYLAWSNALGRQLKLLGTKAAEPPVQTLAEVIASIAAEKNAAAKGTH